MSCECAVSLKDIAKSYRIYKRPIDRLLQSLPFFNKQNLFVTFNALSNIDLEIQMGEVLGVIGNNGAGKSTLLQIICKTLTQSSGSLAVNGRVSALLELGSGFNPEFTGRENVYLSASLAGMTKKEIESNFDQIVSFSGIGDFIDQPVKTYSSGMMVRLAFSVATSVEPDILVIDEALSVGDGAFSRKSFDRIIQLKKKGCTVIFCSHSLYQVEVLCDKVVWLEKGRLREVGEPAGVINAYQKSLDFSQNNSNDPDVVSAQLLQQRELSTARIIRVKTYSDDGQQGDLNVRTDDNAVSIQVAFSADKTHPVPTVGILLTDDSMKNITSNGTYYDNYPIKLDEAGHGEVTLTYPKFGLRRGSYYVHVFLLCENAIHVYDSVQASVIHVTQTGSELGIVSLPKSWS